MVQFYSVSSLDVSDSTPAEGEATGVLVAALIPVVIELWLWSFSFSNRLCENLYCFGSVVPGDVAGGFAITPLQYCVELCDTFFGSRVEHRV